ncbi:PP2C family protein-serine/threonine phosphatase [Kurthia gibsonii]|uniref:PP2C family protein-serine/threonine phosphatase n=1 Tax=Kurthia gibsonii TaxID=33946 RepID=UPI002DBFAA30|nr:PP2C family protein-serine/threonine phosphatase [Kurthia gibsonii]MEB7772800.1 PP2C family protein-serine/threonine phosphatase [Kurthia gibsonii]
MTNEIKKQYTMLLGQYLQYQTERNLYLGQNFSRRLVQKDITPEEVISIHKDSLEEIYEGSEEFTDGMKNALDFLTEFMIQYGLALREHKILLKNQEEMDHELELAANVQKTMLKTTIPTINGLSIGSISVPARKMNGDYIYYQGDSKRFVGVGVADVVGKGIPAALCMSMVKNGLDTLGQPSISPSYAMDVLNRIVEKTVDDNMFISMFYGRYDVVQSTFTYCSAGHEPALLYRAKDGKFIELESEGLLLGVLPDVHNQERSVQLAKGDMVIIMTDGVTECRVDDRFLEKSELTDLIFKHKDKIPQQLAEAIFHEIEKLSQFQNLADDLTFVVLKKEDD